MERKKYPNHETIQRLQKRALRIHWPWHMDKHDKTLLQGLWVIENEVMLRHELTDRYGLISTRKIIHSKQDHLRGIELSFQKGW